MCSTNENVCTTTFLDLPLADAVVGAALEVEVEALLLTALVCPLTRASGTSSGGFILQFAPVTKTRESTPEKHNIFLRMDYVRMVLLLLSTRRRYVLLSKQLAISTCNSIPDNFVGKVGSTYILRTCNVL